MCAAAGTRSLFVIFCVSQARPTDADALGCRRMVSWPAVPVRYHAGQGVLVWTHKDCENNGLRRIDCPARTPGVPNACPFVLAVPKFIPVLESAPCAVPTLCEKSAVFHHR